MRVKNEEPYIRYALESLQPLGGQVVLLDDGSTDATPDIVGDFGDVHHHRQDDLPMDEGRDRTALYQWALELEPEWIFTMDGDEVLTDVAPERMLRAVTMCPDDVNVFDMFLAVMATPPGAKRQKAFSGATPSGWWRMARMFRVCDADKDYEFVSNFTNNLHCGCVPTMKDRNVQRLNAWIKYYGYESPEAVEKKRAFYSEHDPTNFPHVERMWKERMKCGRVVFSDSISCPEIGIGRTVTY